MASNRFKKSIDTATDNTKETIESNIQVNTLTDTKKSMIDNTETDTIDNIKTDIIDNTLNDIKINTSNDILKKVLESGKKDKGSNHTLYLSADVGEALAKLVKKTKKSKSTLVDEILREVLINQ